MSGKGARQRRPGPGPGTALGAAAALLGATACFVGCAAEVSALGREHQTSAVILIAVAVAFGVAAVVLVRVAIRLEHRFRSGGTGQSAGRGRAARGSAAPTPAWRIHNSPVTRTVGVVLIAGVVAGLTALTFSLHGQAAQSSYTQHHGLARRATVEAVRPVNHATSTQAWTTYDYDVVLAEPAGPVTRTVAHDPTQDLQRFDQGNVISVLVDPRQPAYAELPGIPVESAAWFAGPLIMAVVFLGVGTLIVTEEIRHRRARAAAASTPPGAEAPGSGVPGPGLSGPEVPGPGVPGPGLSGP
jgi:hypothetical protein